MGYNVHVVIIGAIDLPKRKGQNEMEISYANSKIQKICTDDKTARKKLGEKCAAVLDERLRQMGQAHNLEQLRFAPGDWHELKGDRKGQLACNLLGLKRLVFAPANVPRPMKSDGGLDWLQITAVVNLEIVDYH